MKIKFLILFICFFTVLTFPKSYEIKVSAVDIQNKGDDLDVQIGIRILSEAYKRIGYDMVVTYLPGERALYSSNNGETDGELMRKKGLEKEYPNLIMVPTSVTSVEFSVFTLGSFFDVKGWSSLEPYSVSYTRGLKFIEDSLTKDTKWDAVNTIDQAFQKLSTGRIDLVVHTKIPGLLTLKQMGIKTVKVLPVNLDEIKLYHYVNIKNKKLVEPLTKVLKDMEKEGYMKKVHDEIEAELIKSILK